MRSLYVDERIKERESKAAALSVGRQNLGRPLVVIKIEEKDLWVGWQTCLQLQDHLLLENFLPFNSQFDICEVFHD